MDFGPILGLFGTLIMALIVWRWNKNRLMEDRADQAFTEDLHERIRRSKEE